MDAVLQTAKDLSQKLQHDETYLNYINAKNILKQNKELYDKVKEFKNNQLNDRLTDLTEEYPSFDREKYLSRLYADLSLIDVSRKYLESEQKFLNKFSEIMNLISQDLDIDLYDLE